MADSPLQSVLRFEHVSLAFGDTVALNDVSFDLKAGGTRIIYGAAGSGKSVMLKVALGLLKPDSGRVYLFDQDVTDLKEKDLFPIRSKIGVLFQEGGLFDSMTIEENVAYPLVNQALAPDGKSQIRKEDIPARVREALRFVELEETLEKFPSELSGGMRRRAGIARATVTEPPLMLYDSPTAGLDPITANTIIALIIKARDTKNTTSAIVTHRHQDGHLIANFRYNPESGHLEPVQGNSDGIHTRTRFMVFGQGRLVFEGTEEELQNSTDPYISKFKAVKA
jgi:phospholipid/cholesterol/gamma-HCH transport system ATP-binding protein